MQSLLLILLNARDVLDVVNSGEQAGDVVGDVPESGESLEL